ncbi:MAG: hypothetical protein JWQ96_834 [Segetibacter sp.]|nr:hypothetical protein [Segetibacter sp.]
MNNRLNILIVHYEEEKARLQSAINECVQEADYLLAHSFSKALWEVDTKLRTFKSFEDSRYNEKVWRLDTIARLEKGLNSDHSDFLKDFYVDRIKQEKEELRKLSLHTEPVKKDTEGIIDETLLKLVERKIKSFSVVLYQRDNLYFQIEIVGRAFKITFPDVEFHRSNERLHDGSLKLLARIGFVNERDNLILLLPYKDSEDLNSLKIVLSRIFFEVFYQDGRETYIRYKE